jgi:regulator of sirC expression with transglutaminase-like and TPR domain
VADCQQLLYATFGSSARLEPAHLAASPKRQILTRVIANLEVAYERAGDLQRARRASEQLAVVQPPEHAQAVRRQQALIRELRERRN